MVSYLMDFQELLLKGEALDKMMEEFEMKIDLMLALKLKRKSW